MNTEPDTVWEEVDYDLLEPEYDDEGAVQEIRNLLDEWDSLAPVTDGDYRLYSRAVARAAPASSEHEDGVWKERENILATLQK